MNFPIGTRFQKLTIIEKLPDGHTYLMQCDCGRTKEAPALMLQHGNPLPCRCRDSTPSPRGYDLPAGSRFFMLTVLKRAEDLNKYTVQCDCGTVKDISKSSLVSGATQSCGCWRKERLRLALSTADVIGNKYGKLTVLEEIRNSEGALQQKCRCDCGNISYVSKRSLTQGETKSCGCLTPKVSIVGKLFTNLLVTNEERVGNKTLQRCTCTCGSSLLVKKSDLNLGRVRSCGCPLPPPEPMAKSHPLYATWLGIRKRCGVTGNKSKDTKHYADRGISMCQEWQDSFWTFVKDMGPRPTNTTIDRIDNDGNYNKDNCRWATPAQQARNKQRKTEQERGIQQTSKGRWRATLKANGEMKLDTTFDTYEQAMAARKEAKAIYWKEE